MKLDETVVDALLAFVQDWPWKRESGGVLIGRRIAGTTDSVVDEITRPMKRDRRARAGFGRRDPGHQRRIDAVWKNSGHTSGYLGEWHTHPERRPSPSGIDRADWGRRLRADVVDGDDVFFVIVGTKEIAVWCGNRSTWSIARMDPSGAFLPSEFEQEVGPMAKKREKPKKKRRMKNGAEFEKVTTHIKEPTRYVLIAAAGGRCQFPDCPRYLFEHHVTKDAQNLSQVAHIIAFREGGPRGDDEVRPEDINAFDNLMLLCHACHKLIDDRPREYPAAKLREWKREHEERVRWLLDLPPENECAVLEIWTNVADPPVVCSRASVIAALRPLYPSKAHAYRIDFGGNTMGDTVLVPAAVESINAEVARLFAQGSERPPHLAVFGITNIPLLVHLGSRLGDRLDTHLYQYHQDTKNWRWKDEEPKATYKTTRVQEGADPTRVALVVSVSGAAIPDAGLAASELPVDAAFTVYELRLTSNRPNRDFLRTRGDLIAFQSAYRSFQSELDERHGRVKKLSLFPAVPVPVAISLGMFRLPKICPTMAVYDNTRDGWKHILDVA